MTTYMKRVRFGARVRPIICAYSGKRKYSTEEGARETLMIVRRERKKAGQRRREKSVYRCVVCGDFHLTSEAS